VVSAHVSVTDPQRSQADAADAGKLVAEALVALDSDPRILSASAWPGSLAHVDRPGLYAWWVDGAGAQDLSAGLGLELPAGRIYVGQAGASSSVATKPSASTLRSRIGRNHLGGKIRSSTLRRTLASILLGPLALMLTGPRRLDPESEARLTAWMCAHLWIAVWPADSGRQLAGIEAEVVAALRPPLNLDHMPPSELRQRLLALRAIVTAGISSRSGAPDPAPTDWREILATLGEDFDGYGYAQAIGRQCHDVAEEVWARYGSEGQFASSYAELRCALFWLQRCVHNAEQAPGWHAGEDLTRRVYQLYTAIEEARLKEGGDGA